MCSRKVGRTVHSAQKRAATLILVVVTIPVMLGMAALTIDSGVLFSTRADLQHAADAAAMAAASTYLSNEMMAVRMGADSSLMSSVRYAATREVKRVSMQNHTFGKQQTYVEPSDIVLGWIDVESGTSPIDSGAPFVTFNAAQVTIRCTRDSTNGPVPLLFAQAFGKRFSDVTATAVATLDDRIVGYDTGADGPAIMPLTININDYENAISGPTDLFSYDPSSDSVSVGADGYYEVNLYPDKQAPGNYGLLNIGLPSMSANELSMQIEDGVPPEDFERETGYSELTFYDEDGSALSYDITGNPGMKVSLEDSFKIYEGRLIAFFVHDKVVNNGSNTIYTVRGMRWGRVMNVSLKAGAKDKGFSVQPISFTGAGVRTGTYAPSSAGAAGRLVLAR